MVPLLEVDKKKEISRVSYCRFTMLLINLVFFELNKVVHIISGAAGILVGFPFDTVKVRIQTQSMIESGPKYTGTLHCLSSIIKNEGVRVF